MGGGVCLTGISGYRGVEVAILLTRPYTRARKSLGGLPNEIAAAGMRLAGVPATVARFRARTNGRPSHTVPRLVGRCRIQGSSAGLDL